RQLEQASDALPVEIIFVPVDVVQEPLEALFGGPWDDLSDGIAVLVGVLGEQPREVTFEGLRSLAPVEVDSEGGEELGKFGHRGPRGVRKSGSSHALNYEFDPPVVQLTK